MAIRKLNVCTFLAVLTCAGSPGAQENVAPALQNARVGLSEQSRRVLERLDAPLIIRVFAHESDFPRYEAALREYEILSRRVSVEYLDPGKNPLIAKRNLVQEYGTLVFEYKDRTVRVASDAEADITSRIFRLTAGPQKIYFVQGHGEKDIASSDRNGYTTIAEALRTENYTPSTLNLAALPSAQQDGGVVVVPGPRTDFTAAEIALLRTYLTSGGRLLVLIDPPDKADAVSPTNLIRFMQEWGIAVGTDIVIDVSGVGKTIGTDASVAIGTAYPPHPITQRFKLVTVFPLARSVSPIPDGANGYVARAVVQTAEPSWASADVKGVLTSGQVTFRPAEGDKKGPLSLATAVSGSTPNMRLVVFGDSDFGSNSYVGVQGNRSLFLATIDWLSDQMPGALVAKPGARAASEHGQLPNTNDPLPN